MSSTRDLDKPCIICGDTWAWPGTRRCYSCEEKRLKAEEKLKEDSLHLLDDELEAIE